MMMSEVEESHSMYSADRIYTPCACKGWTERWEVVNGPMISGRSNHLSDCPNHPFFDDGFSQRDLDEAIDTERVKVVAHLDAVADWYAERSEGYAKINHTSMVIAMTEISKSYRHTARSIASGVHA